jgi:protein-disulfide isomerase
VERESNVEGRETPTRFKTSNLIAILSLVAVAVLWYRVERDIGALKVSQRQLAADVASGGRTPIIDVSASPFLGSKDARVTLVEFSDYECPFCIRHATQTMPQIDATFIQTGKIRYVFRDFPIDQLHPEAIRAHEAARCAAAQDRFWPLHRRLFSAPGTHTRAALEERAAEAGLELAPFRACLDSGRTTADIHASVEEASRLGANGTPAFFVGLRDPATDQVRVARAISGAQPFAVFEQAIGALAAQAER